MGTNGQCFFDYRDAYEDILNQGLLPIYEPLNIFQQNGASCHRSRYISNYLDERRICLLSDWPSQSPDLNIIESLWSYLKARIEICKPANTEQLWKTCKEQWDRIPTENIKKLYQSIPRRIEEVIKMKGRNTHY